uniref:DUF4401 domain-containing protein n=1 Tax=Globodera pallida TaxID=36090 RepID=A0A183BXV5_GLOPA
MLRSPVPLLFLISIVVVNPAEALPNETTFFPEVQMQQVPPGLPSFVPNDTVAWTKFGCVNGSSVWAIIAATTVLFVSLLGALFVEDTDKKPGLKRFGYATMLFLVYVGIFALFGVVDRPSIWSTMGGSVILALIGLLWLVFWRRKELLLLPKYEAIGFLHAGLGYVALLCVGIASYHGAACLSSYNWFIFGGSFVCFLEFLAIMVYKPSPFSYRQNLTFFIGTYGDVLIMYFGILGNLSLVGFGGIFAVITAAAFVLVFLLILMNMI